MDIENYVKDQVEQTLRKYSNEFLEKLILVLDESEREIVRTIPPPCFDITINKANMGRERCRALVTNDRRCSRYAIENNLCKSHNIKRPFGTVDEPIIKIYRKRQASNTRKEISSEDEIDKDKYIETSLYEINDKEYLICMETGLVFSTGRRSDIVDILSVDDLDMLREY